MNGDTIDVQMPDGTTIQGVPKGITQSELTRRYNLHVNKKPELNLENVPLVGGPGLPTGLTVGSLSRFTKGVGRGLWGLASMGGQAIESLKNPLAGVQPAAEMAAKAVTAPTGLEKAGYTAAGMLGPIGSMGAALGERVGTGDIAGAIGEAAPYAMAPKLAAIKRTVAAPIDPVVSKEYIGRGIAEHIGEVRNRIASDYQSKYEHLKSVIDDPGMNPTPPVDAKPVMDALQKGFDEYYSTYTKMGAKVPADIAKVVTEAIQSPGNRWGFEQAKQVRTAIQDIRFAIRKTNPQLKGALGDAADNLTGQMRKAATDAGLGKELTLAEKSYSDLADIDKQLFTKVLNVGAGHRVINILKSNEPYAAAVLPKLQERFGLNADAILEATKAFSAEKNQGRLLRDWHARYLGGEAGLIAGVGWAPGAIAGMLANSLTTGSFKIPKSITEGKFYKAGMQSVAESIPPAPSPLATPEAYPFRPEVIGTPLERPAPVTQALPAQRVLPQAVPEAPVVEPEPPPSPYTQTHAKIIEGNRLNRAIKVLSSGAKRGLSDKDWQWIEEQTGADLTNPANLPKAIDTLKRKRDKIFKLAPEKEKK